MELDERFDADLTKVKEELRATYNAAPSQELPVVVRHSPNSIELMKWGLIPFWAKEPLPYSTINARSETVAEKPTYRKPFKSQRCIIPADGFYEWKKTSDGKQPFYFKLVSGEIFGFAGLYDIWDDKKGNVIKSFTIITTTPNELMEPIHDRMPVILEKDDEDFWLNPDNVETEPLLKLLKPYPAKKMERYPVSKFVNSPKSNGEQLIKPINEDGSDNPSLFDSEPTSNSK